MRSIVILLILSTLIYSCTAQEKNEPCKIKISLGDSLKNDDVKITYFHYQVKGEKFTSENGEVVHSTDSVLEIERDCGDFDVLDFYFQKNKWRDMVSIYLKKGVNLKLEFNIENNRVKLDTDKIKDKDIIAFIEHNQIMNETARNLWDGEFSKDQVLKYPNKYIEKTEQFIARTKGISENIKEYVRFISQTNYLRDFNSLSHAYKHKFRENLPIGIAKAKYNAIDVFSSPYALFYKSATNMVAREIRKLNLQKGLHGYNLFSEQINMAKEKINNEAFQQTIIEVLLLSYSEEFKPGVDFNEKLSEFKQLAKHIKNKEIREDRIKEVENYKYSMTDSHIPSFVLVDTKGNKINLKELFTGQYVYFDLWASWCGPCRAEIPTLKQLEKDYEGKNIKFVGVSCDTSEKPWLKAITKEKLYNTQLLDVKGIFLKSLNVTGIPRFVLYSPDGKLLNINAPRPSSPRLKPLLDKYLK